MVWNRSRDRAATSGLPIADTLRALAGQAEVIVSMLFDATALQEVYLGPDGLITAASGRLFIDMSTVRPGTQQTPGEQVRQAGGAFIECPVGGTIDPARSAAGARRRRGSRPGAPPPGTRQAVPQGRAHGAPGRGRLGQACDQPAAGGVLTELRRGPGACPPPAQGPGLAGSAFRRDSRRPECSEEEGRTRYRAAAPPPETRRRT